MSISCWPIKKRPQRRNDWDQIHRLAVAGGRTLRQLSDEYHIPYAYGTLLNRSCRERWMVAQIQCSKSAAKKRRQASQEFAGAGATNNQTADHNANGVLVSAPSAPRPAGSSEQSDLIKLVTPNNAASFILTATGRANRHRASQKERSLGAVVINDYDHNPYCLYEFALEVGVVTRI